ncbi:MAG: relaxase, partial [Clostridia bacterium]|nr:relaxase [Clostridia bacterium]
YCYRLGYLPKYKIKQNTARLHYLLKEDLMKLDKLTAETTLLGRENIQSVEQLVIYKGSVENEIKTLTEERTLLRKRQRTKAFESEKSEIRDKIFSLTDKLFKLRNELRLCDDILERSGEIQQNLEQVIAEEEKSKRKEARSYDQWR